MQIKIKKQILATMLDIRTANVHNTRYRNNYVDWILWFRAYGHLIHCHFQYMPCNSPVSYSTPIPTPIPPPHPTASIPECTILLQSGALRDVWVFINSKMFPICCSPLHYTTLHYTELHYTTQHNATRFCTISHCILHWNQPLQCITMQCVLLDSIVLRHGTLQ